MRQLGLGGLFLVHTVCTVSASIGFKFSAHGADWKAFLLWQVLGNLAGFAGVLVLTLLYRHIPMHVVYPVTQGMAILALQVVAARIVFRETIQPAQWAGTLLIIAGIVLVTVRR